MLSRKALQASFHVFFCIRFDFDIGNFYRNEMVKSIGC